MARLTWNLCLVFSLGLMMEPNAVRAQGFGGGMGGSGGYSSRDGGKAVQAWEPKETLALLPPAYTLNFITIDGTADIRVAPEGVRVVLAVASEAPTANECQEKNAAQVQAVLKAWEELKIPEEDIVEDFINVLPVYVWRLADRDGQQFRVQQQEGYRMQTNLHVSVKTEKEAMAAINLAFKQGVTEVVTFDYWSSKLNDEKVKAREAALAAAQEKAKTMLAVFDEPPKVINIQENTAVFFPHSLYRTYQNVLEEEAEYSNRWRDVPAVRAYRPKMTFFQGLESRSDLRPAGAAMRPEIAVVSTVRLYYQSPADKDKTAAGN